MGYQILLKNEAKNHNEKRRVFAIYFRVLRELLCCGEIIRFAFEKDSAVYLKEKGFDSQSSLETKCV